MFLVESTPLDTTMTNIKNEIREYSNVLSNTFTSISFRLDQLGTILETSLSPAPEPVRNAEELEGPSIPSWIQLLPRETLYIVFGYLEVQDVASRMSLVCQAWRDVGEDERFWRGKYEKESKEWDTIVSIHRNDRWNWNLQLSLFFSNPQESSSLPPISMKQIFLQRYRWNSKEYNQYIKQSCTLVKNHESKLYPKKQTFRPFTSKPYKIAIFGDGLETSARRLVYKMMWGHQTTFQMTSLYPGKEGIGSGIGFKVNGVDLNLAAIYNHMSVLQKTTEPEKWIEFFSESNALIYVMDSYADLDFVKRELDNILNCSFGLGNVPLLILSCKLIPGEDQDMDESESEETDVSEKEMKEIRGVDKKPVDIAEGLELEKLTRKWCVRHVWVHNLDGVYNGLDWLISVL